MTEDLNRLYRAKVTELLFLREYEGGTLPAEVESAFVAQLEDLWWRLSEREQREFEDDLKALPTSTGPERLDFVDSPVQPGQAVLPRKAA